MVSKAQSTSSLSPVATRSISNTIDLKKILMFSFTSPSPLKSANYTFFDQKANFWIALLMTMKLC